VQQMLLLGAPRLLRSCHVFVEDLSFPEIAVKLVRLGVVGAPGDIAAVSMTRNATRRSLVCTADRASRSCLPVYLNAVAASSCWACGRSRAAGSPRPSPAMVKGGKVYMP